MTNTEIVANEAMLINFPYDGNNLFTFSEWQDRGMKVKKGEHAIINTRLWKPVTKVDKKTGKEETHYILVPAYLFSTEQVEPMSESFREFLSKKFNKQIPVIA
jgi:hypothetical protein